MIAVVSQAWTLDDGAHADAYVALSAAFLPFHRDSPGFRGRRLIRGLEDRTHFTNLRFFDDLASYQAMTERPGYQEHLAKMAVHLKPYTTYPRELLEVVLDDV